ncbi:2-succinyl-6-hydroxy-2,4-cyclohexadiene-1-carboxylate synthase [Testudinibacter sp. TR-2022]|uniref:2-succinyl-6-hydroxy-2, 4-cyclohexadiene-1-carboxylate synthase n=1 Tax=Testudinibacter sp. TR-2022 TaxID=2585029 RepID=UPI00111AAC92|nr:2-succinyl-6-hydroxy-2,4-cyclohexadiene-1-carboxylate synthase [Testudinibacter sp. TR-2022]TNH04760.1 2-succinyl-6-hydroxy-2,4-cyclohexadiene-1-carboxylate synthase [Pasteurellaceae bacterium Phil31]TNH08636.1 2-succinyl-6-hydroxy-2,4-cyclohexadiene-1-carboxylate synthase [Testudinibacter sp. TR-2022]TNH12952.1 2-succinyl-6-hydroxy-2,4-cyclohexadiene-1-carboxylate synthase [Testudinibacter sp. TR-2022]TNH13425.1 2-succinyl-6-hydroxy-2,4-cyclohexadiene-1-carboxylate synthase [Testudinibacter
MAVNGEQRQPCLVFLHGLLGTQADWQPVVDRLPHFHCVSLDLPLHGAQKAAIVADFAQTCRYLAEKIQSAVGDKPYWLIGYSLGGRIALYYALQAQIERGNLQGLIVEGANLGLHTEAEKQGRWLSDQAWAQRFSTEPPSAVLNDWYQQAVFSHLNLAQRQALIEKRASNCGVNIAQMLLATSLAKQPNLVAKVRSTDLPIHFFCGEHDQKFRTQAQQNRLNLTLIQQAGHNGHLENPDDFAAKLTALLV